MNSKVKFLLSTATRILCALAPGLATIPANALPMANLLAGETLSSDDLLFDQWTFISGSSQSTQLVDVSNIDVTIVGDGSAADPWGLRFLGNGEWNLPEGELELNFYYSVTVTDPSKPITRVMMNAEGSVGGPDAYFDVTKDVFGLSSMQVRADTIYGSVLSASMDVGSILSLEIIDSVHMLSWDGEASIQAFEQRFVSNVPLPAAAWLFGSALLGLGAIRRRRPAQEKWTKNED